MKCSHLTTVLVSLALTGCALTPAQKTQREAEKIKAQQLLSIELAKQCDAKHKLKQKRCNNITALNAHIGDRRGIIVTFVGKFSTNRQLLVC